MDEALARQLEPYAPGPSLRMRAVEKLAEAGLSVGVLACPILPRLNDSEASLDALTRAAKQAGAACLAGGVVFLPLAPAKARHPPTQMAPPPKERAAPVFTKSRRVNEVDPSCVQSFMIRFSF